MTCEQARKLDDLQLLMYLDDTADGGAADPEVAAHLRACGYCSARAEALRLTEARLRAAYYRSACPEPLALGDYRLGVLDRADARRIAGHVAGCPHCGRELAQLAWFLSDRAPAAAADRLAAAAAATAGQIRVLVARLAGGVHDALSAPAPALAPAYAGIRGEAAGPMIYEAGAARVHLHPQPDPAAAGRRELLGLLTGAGPAGFTASLWQRDALVASVPVDDGGNFVFSDLAPGACELLIGGPGQEIYVREVGV